MIFTVRRDANKQPMMVSSSFAESDPYIFPDFVDNFHDFSPNFLNIFSDFIYKLDNLTL